MNPPQEFRTKIERERLLPPKNKSKRLMLFPSGSRRQVQRNQRPHALPLKDPPPPRITGMHGAQTTDAPKRLQNLSICSAPAPQPIKRNHRVRMSEYPAARRQRSSTRPHKLTNKSRAPCSIPPKFSKMIGSKPRSTAAHLAAIAACARLRWAYLDAARNTPVALVAKAED